MTSFEIECGRIARDLDQLLQSLSWEQKVSAAADSGLISLDTAGALVHLEQLRQDPKDTAKLRALHDQLPETLRQRTVAECRNGTATLRDTPMDAARIAQLLSMHLRARLSERYIPRVEESDHDARGEREHK